MEVEWKLDVMAIVGSRLEVDGNFHARPCTSMELSTLEASGS